MKSLKGLSDNKLLNQLNHLVKQEHNLTLEILPHLIEVEDRRIYRSMGYSSMFVYCTDGLGYSESSANRRICAARAIRKCPDAYDYLRDGRVNLSTLSIAWKYVTPDLLDEISYKSQRQVFAIVSRFEPQLKHRDSTRPVTVRQSVEVPRERQPARALNGSCGLALSALEQCSPELGQILHRSGGKKSSTDTHQNDSGLTTGDDISTPVLKMETVKMHQVNCLVDDQVMQMLDRCKELLSGKHPCGIDYNTLLIELATTWLDKNDPIERDKRRNKPTKTRESKRTDKGETSRHISPATRDAVYNRDGGQCTYVGSNGKPSSRRIIMCEVPRSGRCNSTWDVEIHHDEVPFARGGSHSLANLRLLCAAHNRQEAVRVYGKDHMKKFKRKNE